MIKKVNNNISYAILSHLVAAHFFSAAAVAGEAAVVYRLIMCLSFVSTVFPLYPATRWELFSLFKNHNSYTGWNPLI